MGYGVVGWGAWRVGLVGCLVAGVMATAGPAAGVAGFGDVAEGRFFAEPIAWMVEADLTTGTAPGCFSPEAPTTRAQAATFVYRHAGEPATAPGAAVFRDVVAGSFYDDAVGWMAANHITTGTTPTTFDPSRNVTRAEFAAFLWRYAGEPAGPAGSAVFVDVAPNSFSDAPIGWMAANHITTGTTPTTFDPSRNVTRAEIATFLWRFSGGPAASTAPQGATCSVTGEREPDAAATALELLAALDVKTENRAGYDRDLFEHWSDLDGDGCDTRQEVLAAESLIAVSTSDGCRVTSGRWLSAYDGVVETSPSDLHIDHLVALAEAWDSGASGWDAATREAFANDQGDRRALIAVTDSSNLSKSDRDPAGWLPPDPGYHCTYATDWVAIKTRWQLAVDTAEATALIDVLNGCPQDPVDVTLAVDATPPNTTTTTTTTTTPIPPNPGDSKNCGDFGTYAEAKAWFDTYYPHYGDVANLDGDNDGIPCESLPGAP